MSNKRILILASCLLLTAPLTRADVSLLFNDGSGQGDAGSYAPGASFTFTITLRVTNMTPSDVRGLSYWFETSAANQNYFTITTRDFGSSPFNISNQDFASGEAIVPGGNQHDLGGTAAMTQAVTQNPQDFFVASIQITINPNTPAGNYTIQTTTVNSPPGPFDPDGGSRPSEANSNTAIFFFAATPYMITVVPEPATSLLLGLAAGGALLASTLRVRRNGVS